jgi:serine/threonine protein kinase
VWKIADFGLATDGTSKKAHTTQYSRGTCSYRAPELLKDTHPTFTNKVDIWALGCILYELVFLARAFPTDYAVIYYAQEFPHTLDIPRVSEIVAEVARLHFITNILKDILKVVVLERPGAQEIRDRFIAWATDSTQSTVLPKARIRRATPKRVRRVTSVVAIADFYVDVSPRIWSK